MKLPSSQTKFLRWLLRLSFMFPLFYWTYLGFTGGLGAQPIVTINHQTGYVVLSLIVANLWLGIFIRRKWLGPQWLRWIFSERRSLGVAAGLYGVLHFLSYMGKEAFEAKAFLQIFEKFYLTMGFFALIIVVSMAATSNDFSVKNLGFQRWKLLHRMIHVASLFILVHIFLIEKGNIPLMVLLAVPLVPFQVFRFYGAILRKNKKT